MPTVKIAGPNRVWHSPPGSTWSSIAYQPQIAQVAEVALKLIKLCMVLHGASQWSVAIEPSYETGVALRVRDRHAVERRAARVADYRTIEIHHVWPLMRSLLRTAGVPISDSVSISWTPGSLQMPVDDVQEMQLSQLYVDARISDWAHEMVRLGKATDIDDARRMIADFVAAAQTDLDRMAEQITAEVAGPPSLSQPGVSAVIEQNVQASALNGAQVESLIGVINQVVAGQIPRETGIGIITASFPLDAERADKILGQVGRGWRPKKPAGVP